MRDRGGWCRGRLGRDVQCPGEAGVDGDNERVAKTKNATLRINEAHQRDIHHA